MEASTWAFSSSIKSKHSSRQVEAPRYLRKLMVIKYVYADNILYTLTLPTIKLSILLMYRRIFSRVKIFQYFTFAVGFLLLGWLIGVLLAQIFTCVPVNGAWDIIVQASAKCIDTTAFYYGNAISNLLTDVIILCLPMPLIWQLQMNTHKKLALSGVLLLGSLYGVSSPPLQYAHCVQRLY